MPVTRRKKAVKKTAARSATKALKSSISKTTKRASASAARATSSAKAASPLNSKASAAAMSQQSEAVMKMGADAIRQMMNQMGGGANQEAMQKQLFNISQESAAQMAKSADAASRSIYEIFELSKDNVDAAVACSSIAVNASKNMGAEMFNYANKSFSQNVEMSKEIFGCRTLNDMFDLQSKLVKANLDHFFNESVKMSEMMFKSANEISEPLNECVNESAQRLSKAMADVA